MKINLIPACIGGGETHQFLSSALVNDTIALDAGCIGFYRSAPEQNRIQHVLISHTHMDHIASLPILVENAYEPNDQCLTVHGSQNVLDCCQRDLFNDRIWPDFIELSKKVYPFLKMSRFEAGETIELEGLRITAIALDHVVPTVGYILADDHSSIGFVSDTGPTDEIWKRINAEPNLKAVFLEATFPNNLAWLAEVSKHLTPALIATELKKLTRPVRIIIVHIKARFQTQVLAELSALNLPNLEIGRFDTPYLF